MRKIISFMHISLDGFVAGPNGEMNWIKIDQEIFDFVAKRISKTELTHMAGISTNAMAKLGRDEDVRMVVLEKICAALNCKIEDIVEIQNGDRLILEEQREIR